MVSPLKDQDMSSKLNAEDAMARCFKQMVPDHLRYVLDSLPEATITKAPSAELRPGQFDQQSLPPYERLDAVIQGYIEDDLSIAKIAKTTGETVEFVTGIVSKIDKNEYKRQQLAPGLRVTKKAFGCGRVMPIAQGWRYGK